MKVPDAETQIEVPEPYKQLLEDLRLLTFDGDNPNRMTKRKREGLWQSLCKLGWVYPILVDEKGLTADGQQRIETCLAHEEYYAPVLRLGIDDMDRRLLRQITFYVRGDHDELRDALDRRRIVEGGGRGDLIRILQINEKDLQKALDATPEETYQLPPLEDVETDIELGDLFSLGPHRLLCGDSTESSSLVTIMGNEKIDCVFTDPPYGVYIADWADHLRNIPDKKSNTRPDDLIYNDEIEDYEKFTFEWMSQLPKHLEEYNSIYVWINGKNLRGMLNASFKLKYKIDNIIIWNKNDAVLSRLDYKPKHEIGLYGWYGKHKFYGKAERNVWDIPKPKQSKLHPTMKPVELCARAIANSSQPDDIILDVFAGSGSTLIACEQLGRRGFMLEIDPRYCQIIIDRYHAYTGVEAEKL